MTDEHTQWTEMRIKVPWGHLAGRWYGDQQRRPILALHGWLDNCGTFATLAPLLVPHCSLFCIDLPGHGYSSHLPAGIIYHRLQFAGIILRVMEEYKWEKVSLMGHSMGGGLVYEFASLHPKRVDMVISIDYIRSIYKIRPDKHVDYLHQRMERALIENERLVNQSPTFEPPNYTFEECEQLLFKGSGQTIDLNKCKYILERNVSRSKKNPSRYYFSRDVRLKSLYEFSANNELALAMTRRICKAQIPYIVIKASDSRTIGRKVQNMIDMLQKHNSNFEMHEIAGERHHLHLNHPEPVAELIIAFLNKHQQTQSDTTEITAPAKL